MSSILSLLGFIFVAMITYQVWKQDQPRQAKIIAIFIIWLIYINISGGDNVGSAGDVNPNPIQQGEQKREYTLEQKQVDFENFYIEYTKRAQMLVLTKATIVEMANLSSSPGELYLALGEISALLESVVSTESMMDTPESLKEYKDLSSAKSRLMLTAMAYKSAVTNFQDYLNESDFEALSDARADSERGDRNLLKSSDFMEKVAEELQVDTSQIKIEE